MTIAWSSPGPEMDALVGPFAEAATGRTSATTNAAGMRYLRMAILSLEILPHIHRLRRVGSAFAEPMPPGDAFLSPEAGRAGFADAREAMRAVMSMTGGVMMRSSGRCQCPLRLCP